MMAGKGPALHLEDVGRGVRLEVWDDVSRSWHSLHRRLLTRRRSTAPVRCSTRRPDTGFLQGAALSKADGVPNAPLHAHEVLAGWDGWSLSAPRPGLTVVHDERRPRSWCQHPTPAPDPDHPVQSVSTSKPGTLPRLRYGRSYAFRAWAVDLAGNSVPHTVAGPADAGDGGVSGHTTRRTAGRRRRDGRRGHRHGRRRARPPGHRRDRTARPRREPRRRHDRCAAHRPRRAAAPPGRRARARRDGPAAPAPRVRVTDVPDLDALVSAAARRRTRRSRCRAGN